MTTLEEQIKERQQDAEKKQLYDKAKLVVEKFGKFNRNEDWYHDSEVNVKVHTFNDAAEALVVNTHEVQRNVDYSWVEVDVSFNGKKVFSARDHEAGAIKSYIPGDWEKKLDTLYLAAQQIVAKEQAEAARKAAAEKAAAEKRAAEKKAAAERETRGQWGLEETSHDVAAARQKTLKKAAPKIRFG
jgi:colicin import membrane protein